MTRRILLLTALISGLTSLSLEAQTPKKKKNASPEPVVEAAPVIEEEVVAQEFVSNEDFTVPSVNPVLDPYANLVNPYQSPRPKQMINGIGVYPKLKDSAQWNGRAAGTYSLQFKINGLQQGDEVYLADHHIGGKYLRDTAFVDKKGIATFTGNQLLQRGMYLFVMPQKQGYFEFMIDDDQEFLIETDTAFYTGEYYTNMKVLGSEENLLFINYQKGKTAVIEKLIAVDDQMKTPPDCESYSISSAFMLGTEAFAAGTSIDFCTNEIILDGKSYDAELGLINKSSVRYYFNTSWAGEVELLVNFTTNSCIMRMRYDVTERADFQISKSVLSSTSGNKALEEKRRELLLEKEGFDVSFIKNNPNSLLARFLYSMVDVPYPDYYPVNDEGEADSSFPYQWYKTHYWDHIDFNEEGLVRMPVNIMKQKMDFYFDKLILPDPDSCIQVCEFLLNKTAGTVEMEKYITWYLTNRFESSNIMGQDKVFVYLALNTYCRGKAWWADSNTISKMCENAYRRAHTVIGEKAPPLELQDQNGNWVNTYSIQAPYTIMIFWDPTCGHCKEVMPKLAKIYAENKDKGWKVIALSSGDKRQEWMDYLAAHPEMSEWTHLIRDKVQSEFMKQNLFAYYVIASPTIYILDGNRNVAANRIDVEKIAEFIGHLDAIEKAKQKAE